MESFDKMFDKMSVTLYLLYTCRRLPDACRVRWRKAGSAYYKLEISPAQIEAILDLWASFESRKVGNNTRDLRALSSLLLGDFKRTEDLKQPATEIERAFRTSIHKRLVQRLQVAGFKPEGATQGLQKNRSEEREWLRNAAGYLARNATDPSMRYEWQLYADELRVVPE